MRTNYVFIIFILLLFISCQNSDLKNIQQKKQELPQEKSDSFLEFLKDTTTKAGFEISYKSKENSTDLIIQIKKDSLFKEFVFTEMLEMKLKNCPVFILESKEYLYFEYYSGGSNLWIIQKSTLQKIDIYKVVAKDFERNLVFYITDNQATTKFKCHLVNLSTNKTQEIIFDGICRAAETNYCIKEAIFEKENLIITALLWKNEQTENEKEVMRKIKL